MCPQLYHVKSLKAAIIYFKLWYLTNLKVQIFLLNHCIMFWWLMMHFIRELHYMSHVLIETLNRPFVTPCYIHFASPNAGWTETPRDLIQLSWGLGNKQHSSGKQPLGSQFHRITASRLKHHWGGEHNGWSVCPYWVLEFSQRAPENHNHWQFDKLLYQLFLNNEVEMIHKASVNHLELTNRH